MLPTFHWAYEKDVVDYPFDPAKAKQLLDEAGYPDPDGDGPLPRFTLVYKTSSNKLRVAIANVIASMLAEVGIGVDMRVNEFATLFADLKKGNFQISLMQIPEISEPDLYINFFASERIPTRDNLDAGGNRERYRNPEIDRLIVEGRRTLDRPGRKRGLLADPEDPGARCPRRQLVARGQRRGDAQERRRLRHAADGAALRPRQGLQDDQALG